MGKLVRSSSTGDKLAMTIARKPERFLSVEIRAGVTVKNATFKARGAAPSEYCEFRRGTQKQAPGELHRDANKAARAKMLRASLDAKATGTLTKYAWANSTARCVFAILAWVRGQNKQHRHRRIP
jgi:hypothetical protein